MYLRIKAKRDGFRRCGIEHFSTPVLYPPGRFTEEEVRRLKNEPMLSVEELNAPPLYVDTETDGAPMTDPLEAVNGRLHIETVDGGLHMCCDEENVDDIS